MSGRTTMDEKLKRKLLVCADKLTDCPTFSQEATMFLNERVGQPGRGLAVIGFSLGAYYALDLAAAHPEHIRAVVLFYGTGGGDVSSVNDWVTIAENNAA